MHCLGGFLSSARGFGHRAQQGPQDWKRSVFIPIPKKGNAKECSNYHTIALISHTSKVMLKILQARLQKYVNRELPDVQAGFRKSSGTRDQIANICWNIEKARVPVLCPMSESPSRKREGLQDNATGKKGKLLLTRARALCCIQCSGASQRAQNPSCYTNL